MPSLFITKCDFHFIWQCPERTVTMVGWKSRTCLRQIYCCCLQSTKTSLSQTGFIDCTCTNENAVIEIFAMASYIFTRMISQLVMAIGDSRDLHKQSVYNIMLFCSTVQSPLSRLHIQDFDCYIHILCLFNSCM